MVARLVFLLVVGGLLCATVAEAQPSWCGGHRIGWVGGAPGAFLDMAPDGDQSAAADAADAGYIPTHRNGSDPIVPEPSGLNRERWDQLVFNAHDQPRSSPPFIEQLAQRRTLVIDREVVSGIGICVQSAETSTTGQRLAPYANESWWREQILRWTGLPWNGEFRVGACTGEVPDTWIYVREDTDGRLSGNVAAAADSRRESHAHHRGRWIASELFWNPRVLQDTDEAYFETTVAHELGHALGFSHVALGSGYVMTVGVASMFPEEESSLAQLAYQVGPDVRYPGVVREDGTGDMDHPDRPVLTRLYEETGGQNWAESSNWATDAPLARWHGVATGADGRVTELSLHENELSGAMPAALGRLSSLQLLEFTANKLTGDIPAALGGLSGLEHLRLERNALSGPIPSDLGDLSNLRSLVLGQNALTGSIPAELGRLSNLTTLYLTANDLTGTIPPWLGNLSGLIELVLERNNLSGSIPAELGQLSHLLSLNLGDNNLTGPVPPELGGLANVSSLVLRFNNLTGPLPSSLMSLQQLDHLDIGNNAGLCAPADDAFQAWLATIDFVGDTCTAEPVPALPGLGLVVAGLLLSGIGTAVARRRRSRQVVGKAPVSIGS